jgi:hypothetical protein
MSSTPSIAPTASLKQAAPNILQVFILCGIFAAAVFGYLMNTSGWLTMIPGDLGDARFNSVVLEHLYQWVNGVVPKLWSPRFFFPFENTLAFSDSHFGSGWSYVAFRFLGLPREEAYLSWFLLGAALNFWVCWYVLRRLGFSVAASAFGAFVFAFALPALHKENHAQLVYRFAIPLAVAAWYRFLTAREAASVIQTIIWVCIQFLCSIYVGVFLAYLLIAMLLAQLLLSVGQKSDPRLRTPWFADRAQLRSLKGLFAALGAILLLVVVLFTLRRYQHVAGEYGFTRPLSELFSMLPRLESYLLADQSGLTGSLGRSLTDIPMRHEQQMFIGVGAGLLLIIGFVRTWASKTQPFAECYLARVMSIALVLLVLVTLCVGDWSVYAWLAQVPGVSSIRAVSRIALVMLFPAAVLVAFGIDWVSRSAFLPTYGKTACLLIAAVVLTTESFYYQPHHTPMQSWRARQDQLGEQAGAVGKDAVLFVTQPKAEPFFMTEIDAMIYAQNRHIPTLNGYSGNTPPRYTYPDPCLPVAMRIDSYIALRGMSPAKRQHLVDNLHVVTLEPCSKPDDKK